MRWLLLFVLFAPGCTDDVERRVVLNARTKTAVIHEKLSVDVYGASITDFIAADSGAEADFGRVVVRSQSMDTRIDMKVSSCLPEVLHFTLSHANTTTAQTTAAVLLDARSASDTAANSVLGAGVSLASDTFNPNWTLIGDSQSFEVERNNGVLTWTVCANRPLREVRYLTGHQDYAACDFPNIQGACAEPNLDVARNLESSALVIRQRIQTPVENEFSFAIWGNNAGKEDVQDAIIESVNTSGALFAIVNGDLTEDGSLESLEGALTQLDGSLQIPWFATLGDRDVQGALVDGYTATLGSSSFAFDAGPVRIIVVDSADRAIGTTARELMRSWLGGVSLGWGERTSQTDLMITHVPPFDLHGTRSLALKDHGEAASMTATMKRENVSYMVTSQLGRYHVQSESGVRIVHSGGGGAQLESGQSHHWLRVDVRSPCSMDDPGAFNCQAVDGLTECVCIELIEQTL